jgi:hypothetical protein
MGAASVVVGLLSLLLDALPMAEESLVTAVVEALLLAVMRPMVSAICRLMVLRHALPREWLRWWRGDDPPDGEAGALVVGRSGFVDAGCCGGCGA